MLHYRAQMIIAATLMLATAIIINHKRIEHNLAGIPHWSTSCPQKAAAILVIGQSHASNTGPFRKISLSGSRAFANGKCYYLRDPMPGTKGRGGTIWPKFADLIGRSVVIADIAVSGSSIQEWNAPRQQKAFQQTLRDLRVAGYPKPLIIWMQGETDAARHTSEKAYYTYMRKLIESGLNYKWLITRESICYDLQKKWLPLDIARNKIARDFSIVKLGPDIDKIGLPLRQPDRCHLTNEGQDKLSISLAESAKHFID